jgi:hypothetical protein
MIKALIRLSTAVAVYGQSVVSDSPAGALRAEAAAADELASRLRKAADAIDDQRWVGTALNEYKADESQCYAIGRLLDHGAYVMHLKIDKSADLNSKTSENARTLRIQATGLENFAIAIRNAFALQPSQRAIEWNLNCAGKLHISATLVDQSAIHTFYTVTNDRRSIRVLGDIEDDFSTRLIGAIKANPAVSEIILGSGGGNVREAILAGEFIRANKLNTTLGDACYSACPLVFLAGQNRSIWSPYPVLGFHEVRDAKTGAAPSHGSDVYKIIYQYVGRMGVDPQFVLTSMWSAPPTAMNEISGNDERLCKARVATWIQRSCSADNF